MNIKSMKKQNDMTLQRSPPGQKVSNMLLEKSRDVRCKMAFSPCSNWSSLALQGSQAQQNHKMPGLTSYFTPSYFVHPLTTYCGYRWLSYSYFATFLLALQANDLLPLLHICLYQWTFSFQIFHISSCGLFQLEQSL